MRESRTRERSGKGEMELRGEEVISVMEAMRKQRLGKRERESRGK